MEQEDLWTDCKALILEGKAYHEIKIILEKKGLEQTLLKSLLQQVDEWIAAYELAQQAKEKYLIQTMIGLVLALVGCLIYIFSKERGVALVLLFIGGPMAWKSYKQYQNTPHFLAAKKPKRKGKFERF